ncbi:MAG: hypothetical protein Q8K12_09645 [Thiobacillus sp.]|nr:hypothetical protein [Thiobacillus sp.]
MPQNPQTNMPTTAHSSSMAGFLGEFQVMKSKMASEGVNDIPTPSQGIDVTAAGVVL